MAANRLRLYDSTVPTVLTVKGSAVVEPDGALTSENRSVSGDGKHPASRIL
jgi:hypothetical protein